MRSIKLFFALILLYLFATISVVRSAETQLTVFMVVRGLNSENVERLRPYIESGGLRLLEKNSSHYDITFPHDIHGGIEGLTTLLTGTTPSEHTVNANYYFHKKKLTLCPTLYDKEVTGIVTDMRLSPKQILSPTFADKMRLQHGKSSKIYAIGLDAQTTIIMAGHGANACCWLDSATQQWVSTTFYPRGLPAVADKMNIDGTVADKMDLTWFHQMDISAYISPTKEEQQNNFQYKNREYFYNTPAVNDLVLELALQLQKSVKLGKDNIPDFLFLELTTLSPKATSDYINSAEHEDMYLRLNQNLANFIQTLNSRIGEGKYQIILVGMPYLGIDKKIIEQQRQKYTVFNLDRAIALTSSYLVALYGNKSWISGGYGRTLYLNRKVIADSHLNLQTIQQQVADFLMEFEGVRLALPFREALHHPNFSNIINKYHFGDVVFNLEPFCQEYTNDNSIFDYLIYPHPSATLWRWQKGEPASNKIIRIDATQCIDICTQNQ